jgi:hypothetical protein
VVVIPFCNCFRDAFRKRFTGKRSSFNAAIVNMLAGQAYRDKRHNAPLVDLNFYSLCPACANSQIMARGEIQPILI